jgi:Ca2+-binding RTX toxin-like protein
VVVPASVCRAGVRAAVALVVVVATACVCVASAQAWSTTMQIAFQANTGFLWNWTINDPGSRTPYGMAADASPSEGPVSAGGAQHEIAFQANTGNLWTVGPGGHGATPYGIAAGTSPSLSDTGIAFQAQGTYSFLWVVGAGGSGGDGNELQVMAPGTSPSLAGAEIAYVGTDNQVWVGEDRFASTGFYTDSSPAINATGDIAMQDSGGDLWTGNANTLHDTGLAISNSSGPSINDNGDVAFDGSNGDLWVMCCGGDGDTGAEMMPGTDPSIDDQDDVAFQGSNGDLWIWIAPASGVASGAHDLGLGVMAGTSPSISLDPGLIGAARPRTSRIAGAGNNRLHGGPRNDLIYGGRGNDRVSGARGNDQLYGGPGNDQLYGGAGNDRIYGGPGNDRTVDLGGATTVFPGSGANWVDVADRHSDDRVACAPGSTNHIVADRHDRIAFTCRGKRSTIRYVPGRQSRRAH